MSDQTTKLPKKGQKLDVSFFENVIVSGESWEDLRKMEIQVEGVQLKISRMKNKNVHKVISKISEIDWDNSKNYAEVIAKIYEVIPLAVGIPEEKFDELDMEVNEAILVQFLEENQYFLRILFKLGIYQRIKSILSLLTESLQETSKDSESDIEEKEEKSQVTSSNKED